MKCYNVKLMVFHALFFSLTLSYLQLFVFLTTRLWLSLLFKLIDKSWRSSKRYCSCCQLVFQIHKHDENNASIFSIFYPFFDEQKALKYTGNWEYLKYLILGYHVDKPEADIHVCHWGPSLFLSKQQYYPDLFSLAPETDQWAPSTL